MDGAHETAIHEDVNLATVVFTAAASSLALVVLLVPLRTYCSYPSRSISTAALLLVYHVAATKVEQDLQLVYIRRGYLYYGWC